MIDWKKHDADHIAEVKRYIETEKFRQSKEYVDWVIENSVVLKRVRAKQEKAEQ